MSIGQAAEDASGDGTTAPSDLETIFARARQGAANVAGVRFQILVTGWLLVMGDRLPIPVSSVLPEGLEDVDCQTADGRRVLVQVKERRGGDTTWPIGEMVAAVEHAEPALGAAVDATLIVVTNARPGRGLAVCRLDQTLRDVLEDPTALTVALEAASLDPDLHGRAALTTLSGPVIHEEAIAAVTADHHVAPAIAALIWARLLEELYSIAAGQRGSTPATAARADRSTVDTLAEQVQGTVNPDALQEPVRRGLIGTLDFSMPLDVAPEQFLLGVDVRPGHIAAGLDLLRPAEMQAVFAALERGAGAVLRGPSGSGKSALLWRCAYELTGQNRTVHLRRVTDDDVETIVRWLRLLRPTAETPVLVCADDLGRPRTAGWPELVRRLTDVPHVLAFGACREEDFSADVLGDSLELVRLRLDAELAEAIAQQLEHRGVTMRRSTGEAFADADGLLLEYVALLTTGERLECVVGRQVDDRLPADRAAERQALRLVAAAHTAGLGIRYDALAELVDRPDDLPQALHRLADELLVDVDDQQRWFGLHELRSTAAHARLHAVPPPTELQTFAALLPALDGAEIAHLIRRQADRALDMAPLTDALADRFGGQGATAGDIADVLDALADADATAHARDCWALTLEIGGPAGARDALIFAHAIRFAGVPAPDDAPAVATLADALPDRGPSLARAVAEALDRETVLAAASQSPPPDALRLAESLAASGAAPLSDAHARDLLATIDLHDGEERARCCYATWTLAGRPADPARVLGPRNLRVDRLAHDDDVILAWTCEPQGDALTVSLKLFSRDGRLDADLRRYATVASLLCPEATHVALTVCTPKGTTMAAIPDDAQMQAPRLPGPIDTAAVRAFAGAVERVRAADSLSERIDSQQQITPVLADLLAAAPIRLLAADDDPEERARWSVAVADTQERIGALPAMPIAKRPGQSGVADPAARRLKHIAVALAQVAEAVAGDRTQLRGAARLLRDQIEPSATNAEGPLAAQLAADLSVLSAPIARLADTLLARSDEPDLIVPAADAAACDAAVAETLTRSRQRDLAILNGALAGLDATVHPVGGDGPDDLLGPQWLVTLPFEGRDSAVWDRLGTLKGEDRQRLAFRVTVVPLDAGWLLGGQAWRIGRQGLYPAEPRTVRDMAGEIGLAVVDTPQLHDDLRLPDEVVEASVLAAWAACRRAGRFPADRILDRLERQIALFEEHARDVAQRVPPIRYAPVLTDYIRREAAGDTPVSLASGDALLRRFGDENGASMLISGWRGAIEAVAARSAGSPDAA